MTARSIRRDAASVLIVGALAALCAQLLIADPGIGGPFALCLAAAPVGWWVVNEPGRWVPLFFATALLLPPLPFPWGDSGVHPSLFFAALGVWAGIAQSAGWKVLRRPESAAVCFLLLALLASIPFAATYSGLGVAAQSLARVALFSISVYLFFYLADGPGKTLEVRSLVRVLFWCGFVSAAFACLDFYFQFPAPARFAEQFVWLPGGVFRRAQGVFYEASTLGLFCVFLLVMIASVAVNRLGKRIGIGSIWLAAGGAALLGALILSFSRTALISLGVSLVALVWLEGRRRGILRKFVRLSSGLLALAAFVGFVLHLSLPDFLEASLSRFWLSGVYLLEAPNLILSRRLESWAFLLDYLSRNPWHAVLGTGYKTLPYSNFVGRPVVADNTYLSLLVETGLVGLAGLFMLHIVVLRAAHRLASQATHDLARMAGTWLFSFWCGFAVQMLSGDVLTYWRILPAFLALLAVCLREADDENPVSRPVL